MSGVACPMAKLLSQLDEAPIEIPFALTPRGKTSATRTHAPGWEKESVSVKLREHDAEGMTYSPRVSKVDLVDPDEYNGNPASGFASTTSPAARSKVTVQSSDDDVRNTHADGTGDEDGLATKLIDVKDGRDGGEHEQDTADTTSQKRSGVASQTQVLEDESGVVQNGVDTRP